MSSSNFKILAYIGICLVLGSCAQQDSRPEWDQQLAQVYDKSLYLSQMEGMLPIGISSEDSTLIINKYVKNWVRETAMLNEAEQHVPTGLNISQLVEDYRASLIKHNYENILVNKLLDSIVTNIELENFYNKNKEQFKLETPIMRCLFVKAQKSAPQIKQTQEWWSKGTEQDLASLKTWCETNANVHHLQDNSWSKVVDIGAYMPQGILTNNNVANKKEIIHRDDDFIYLFQLKELIPKGEFAPLSYIEGQASKVILHKRKTELLDEMKDRLYDEAMRKNSIAIFSID